MVRRISDMVQVSYTRQKEPLGLDTRCWWQKIWWRRAGSRFLLGDVLIPGGNPATKQLIDVYAATGVRSRLPLKKYQREDGISTESWTVSRRRSRRSERGY